MLPQHSAGVLGTLAIHAFSKTQLEIGAKGFSDMGPWLSSNLGRHVTKQN